jgi:hypothetical protein
MSDVPDQQSLAFYDNGAAHWIRALLMKPDIGSFDMDGDGTQAMEHSIFKLLDFELQWIFSPTRIKYFAKLYPCL